MIFSLNYLNDVTVMPNLDDNQAAIDDSFFAELARATLEDATFLHPLPTRGV